MLLGGAGAARWSGDERVLPGNTGRRKVMMALILRLMSFGGRDERRSQVVGGVCRRDEERIKGV